MEPRQREQLQPDRGRGLHYGWLILVTCALLNGVSIGLARFGFGTILPAMQQSMGFNHEQTGFIASADLFGYFISALGAGLLASRFGPRIITLLGLLWIGLAMVATGLANGMYTIALARFFTGVGSAGTSVAIMGLAAAWFGASRRGMATGIIVGGAGLGLAVTGWTVPLINSIYPAAGWRYNWFLLGAIALAAAVLAAFVLRNNPAEKKLAPIGGTTGAPVAVDGDKKSFLFNIKGILKISGVFPLAAMYFCYGFSYVITSTYLVIFLMEELGCSQKLAGHIWSVTGMISIANGLIWGMLSDRLGRRSMMVTIFLLQACCYLLLQARFSGGFLLWLPALLFGLTTGSIPGLVASCCGDLSDAKRATSVLGLVTFVFGLGQVLGPVSAGYVKEFTGSFAWAFVLAAAVAASGALFSSRIIIPRWRHG